MLAVMFIALAALRSGTFKLTAYYVLGALWLVGAVATLSSLFSGDVYDSFIGDTFSVYSSLFILLIALVVTVSTILSENKIFVARLYLLLTISAVLVAVFQLLLVFFSFPFLSLGIFSQTTESLLGGWNDLALFYGLILILTIVALAQLSLNIRGRVIVGVLVSLSLIMLAIVNLLMVWMVVAGVSLLALMYALSAERINTAPQLSPGRKKTLSKFSLSIVLVIFIVSAVFIVGGSSVGNVVNRATGIEFVAVKPSFIATVDILKSTYATDPILGFGANRFADAWRIHKDPSINETIFWATNFSSGSGYIMTQFVNLGILGSAAWILFFILFVGSGVRALFRVTNQDKIWYFLASSSFIAAIYFWILFLIYNPGATLLLLTALFTGIALAAFGKLCPEKVRDFSVHTNNRANILLVGFVMVTIVGSVSLMYYSARHYTAVYQFINAIANSEVVPLEETERKIMAAYSLVPSDTFAQQLVQYQIAKMSALFDVAEPTTEQQQLFEDSAVNGIALLQQSLSRSDQDPLNFRLLGDVFSILAATQVADASQRAEEAYAQAKTLDPLNPLFPLLNAQLALIEDDTAEARRLIGESLSLKSNFTDALLLQVQIDISENNVTEAIASVRSIISIEPNNPARYYQLGILLITDEQLELAKVALERAVGINPDYANALYYLALTNNELGDTETALAQLERVLELNPGNESVMTLIEQVRAGNAPRANLGEGTLLPETSTVSENQSETVTTAEDLETPLIVPVGGATEAGNASNETSE